MNPVVMPVRNNIGLTKIAVKSVLEQDVKGGAELLVVDNGSTDGMGSYLRSFSGRIRHCYRSPGWGVAESWNKGLKYWFGLGAEYVLVINNDVELRSDAYRWLVEDGGGFVTAVGTRDRTKIEPQLYLDEYTTKREYKLVRPNPKAKRPHPDFSCFLIRKWVFEQVGEFDECFKGAYCEDSSYHLRMHRAGVKAVCLDLPFLHHGAMTVKNGDELEVRKIQVQADENRRLFEKMYGFGVGSKEYYREFGHGEPVEESIESTI